MLSRSLEKGGASMWLLQKLSSKATAMQLSYRRLLTASVYKRCSSYALYLCVPVTRKGPCSVISCMKCIYVTSLSRFAIGIDALIARVAAPVVRDLSVSSKKSSKTHIVDRALYRGGEISAAVGTAAGAVRFNLII
jgi:hypothetical protein